MEAEQVIENIESVLEEVPEKLREVKSNNLYTYIGVAALTAGAFGLGYLLGKRRRVLVVPAEDPEVVFFDAATGMPKDDIDVPPVVAVIVPEDLPPKTDVRGSAVMTREQHEAHRRLLTDYTSPETIDVVEELPQPEVERNIFATTGDEWDYEAEVASRDESKPYIIHKDEYYEETAGFAQSTLTYYAGDDTLVDEHDNVINDPRRAIGEEMRFGHGSADPRTFHVRNHAHNTDYEVLLHDGKHSIEVLGQQDERELRHSRNRIREG